MDTADVIKGVLAIVSQAEEDIKEFKQDSVIVTEDMKNFALIAIRQINTGIAKMIKNNNL